MPYKYPDLKGSGKDLLITSRAEVAQPVGGLPNTQGGIRMTTAAITYPGIYYPDTTGFFAPVWGSGSEVFSIAVPVSLLASGAIHYLITYGQINAAINPVWGLIIDVAEKFDAFFFNSVTGLYLDAMTPILAAASYMVHVEYKTGSSRQILIYVNGALAVTSGAAAGTPLAMNGTEALMINANTQVAASLGNTNNTLGGVGFKRGLYTAAEKAAHFQALNIA